MEAGAEAQEATGRTLASCTLALLAGQFCYSWCQCFMWVWKIPAGVQHKLSVLTQNLFLPTLLGEEAGERKAWFRASPLSWVWIPAPPTCPLLCISVSFSVP